MNYLAHAYLSNNEPGILVGNMISDLVKGKQKFNYAKIIQKGIMHHRAIDEFTDRHKITIEAKQVFKPAYGLYAGAFIDVVYDHFLANDKNEFAGADELIAFSQGVYKIMNQYFSELPLRFQQILPHMESYDWLSNYKSIVGMSKSFAGLVHRAKYIHETQPANNILLHNYSYLNHCYDHFFKELKNFSSDYLSS